MPREPVSLKVDDTLCTGCGLCVSACPAFVLALEDAQARVLQPDWCIDCGHCAAVCPVEAVTLGMASPRSMPRPGRTPAVTPEALDSLIRERRSIRLYRSDPVPRDLLEAMLDAGRQAPTGSNSQNVCYILLTSPQEIAAVRELVLGFYTKLFRRAGNPLGALLVALVAGRKRFELLRRYLPMVEIFKERYAAGEDRLFYHAPVVMLVHAPSWDSCSAFNCTAALYTCSLKAHTLGLGCCFNGFLENAVRHDRKLKARLEIPKDHACFAAMTVGYPNVEFLRLVERRKPRVVWR
jgi:nitroreductase/NAD-dependent dihydropyrimidine dehydrogenase PreA subunit